MKRIRDFKAPTEPAKAEELRRQLGQLESNVSDAFDAADAVGMRRLQVKQRITDRDGETVAPGQSLGITYVVKRVQLAVPQANDAGKFLAICKGAGAATNTTVFAPARSLINGAASFVIGTSGLLQLIYCDGLDYWAVP